MRSQQANIRCNSAFTILMVTVLFISTGFATPSKSYAQVADSTGEQVEFTVKGTVMGDNAAVQNATVTIYSLFGDQQLASTTTGTTGTYQATFKLSKVHLSPAPRTYKPWYHEENRGGLFRIEIMKEGFERAQLHVANDSSILVEDITLKKPSLEITISSVSELRKIGHESAYPLDGHYKLTADIDASATANWNNGKGFDPIGQDQEQDYTGNEKPFTGTFDGQGHTITGLTINRPDGEVVGLFSRIEGGTLKNLELREVSITGNTNVGGFAGTTTSLTTIKNCSVTGNISGFISTGMLTGVSILTKISGANTAGSVSTPKEGRPNRGNSFVMGNFYDLGGITGVMNRSLISHSEANVDFKDNRNGFQHVGGLAGNMTYSAIKNSHASGDLSLGKGTYYGGLAGASQGLIFASYAEGTISSDGYETAYIGGLTGNNQATIRQSYATGEISVPNDNSSFGIGGIAGQNMGMIASSYATVNIIGAKSDAGGLVGQHLRGQITSSYAAGQLSSGEASSTGGLIGSGDSGERIENSYWDRSTSGWKKPFGEASDNKTPANGLTTEQMTGENAKQNMPGLDFDQTWKIIPGQYPALRWESETNKSSQ